MNRAIGAMAVVVVVAGLSLAYRDLRPRSANSAPRLADDLNNLNTPPNWKVESAASRVTWRAKNETTALPPHRYGVPNSTDPPLWVRRSDKVAAPGPAPAPTYLPKNRTIESPHVAFLPTPVLVRTASVNRIPPAVPASKAIKPANPAKPAKAVSPEPMVAISAHPAAKVVPVADEAHRALLRHAKFLIKAGLAPMAEEPLRQIIRDLPNTPIALEARSTLDTIRN